jgi:hypothetical protein
MAFTQVMLKGHGIHKLRSAYEVYHWSLNHECVQQHRSLTIAYGTERHNNQHKPTKLLILTLKMPWPLRMLNQRKRFHIKHTAVKMINYLYGLFLVQMLQ